MTDLVAPTPHLRVQALVETALAAIQVAVEIVEHPPLLKVDHLGAEE
jgi:hypothetical protein